MEAVAHQSVKELQRRSRLKEFASFAERIKAAAFALQGETAEAIAEKLDRHISWVFKWITRFNELGFDGLQDQPRSGQPRKLTLEQEEAFKKRVLDGPTIADDGISRFTGEHLITILKTEFSVVYSLAGVYLLLHRMRLSHITPRPSHPKNDPQKMQEWKEELPLLPKKQKKPTKTRPSKSGSKTKPVLVNKESSPKSGPKRTHARLK